MGSDVTEERLQISAVIREIHRALVTSETRASLESAVCSAFATSSPYVSAWIGTHDTDTDDVVPRASAGMDSTYLAEISISVTAEPTNNGPTATALRTGDSQVMQDIRTDPAYEPWREQALEHGFESSAAVPIADGSDSYGVLNLYADRRGAFDDREQQLLSELGETIASAISGLEARRELEAQKEKYERLATRVSDAFYAVDSEWRITYWNDRMAERTERPASEVLGTRLWEAFPTLEGTDLGATYREAMAENEAKSLECHVGEPFDYWVAVRVYPDEDGLSVFSRKITEQKEREKQREESNAVLRTIVENLPMGVLVEDTDRNVIMANDALCAVLDLDIDCEALIGRDCDAAAREIRELFADSEEFLAGIDERLAARTPVHDEQLRLADGRVLERDYVPYELPDGEATLWLYRDVTDRVEREQKLIRSRQIIENSTDIATIIDPGGTIRYVSPAVERVLGYEPAELIGQDGFGYQPSETSAAVAEAINDVLDNPGETRTVQTRFRRADGSWRWVESTLRNRLDDDRIAGILVSSRDITERKAYRQRIETQRDNLQTLNQVVRHDIRNDLQLVTIYADLLAEHIDVESDEHEYIETLRERSEHAVELTMTAGEMAEVMLEDEPTSGCIPLRDVLVAELQDVREAYPEAEITTETELPTVDVKANEMLESVVRNLLKNAVQHNDKPVPEVTVGVETTDETVRIRVADNGPGVPDAQKDDIFGRGNKGLDSGGTGLGLYLVQSLVESYGGEIELRDNDPEGAVFVVDLPKAA